MDKRLHGRLPEGHRGGYRVSSSGSNDTSGHYSGSNDRPGNDTGGNDTGGNDTGGNDTGGNDTGGNDTGGNDTGGNAGPRVNGSAWRSAGFAPTGRVGVRPR
jgi:hypothetical protein